MKAENFQNMHLAGWRPMRANGGSLHSKNWQTWDPRDNFSVRVWGQEIALRSSSQAGGVDSYSPFLFYLCLQSIGWGLHTLVGAIGFTKTTDLNVNRIQKQPYRLNQNNVWPNAWAPFGSVGVTHKINHYKAFVLESYLTLLLSYAYLVHQHIFSGLFNIFHIFLLLINSSRVA